jgi:signal transduction histidine kinase/CheY-like chemotaxis protein
VTVWHRYLRSAASGLCLLAASGLRAGDPPKGTPVSPAVLTSFEEIWRAAEQERDVRHPVRFDYTVYYYDPAWQALWGRSGAADSYLSFGTRVFPIAAGQRIHVEGTMVPARGMLVDDPAVTVLGDASPIEVLSTRGDVTNATRYNKRFVSIDGYVDRQLSRDATHVDIELIAEGRTIYAELLLKGDNVAPLVRGDFVRLKGVYFARMEDAAQRIELWVPGPDCVQRLGGIDYDQRFALPVTSISRLASLAPDVAVKLSGVVRAQTPGRSVVIADQTGEITVATPQTQDIGTGGSVLVVGTTTAGAGGALRDVLYRAEGKVLTQVDDVYRVPAPEQQEVHRIRMEVLVYYYDPHWKVMWARSGNSDHYISLGGESLVAKPGQQILIEGTVTPARGMLVSDPQLTVLQEHVPIEIIDATSDIGDSSRLNKHMVSVEGYVDRQVLTDPAHMEVDLLVNDRLVSGRMLVGASVPQLEGALVQAQGVYSATSDPAGGPPKLELWVQGPEWIRIKGRLDRDQRFAVPVTPIERLGSATPDRLVRISGVLRAQQPGVALTLRDDTGQVTVRSVQTMRLALGDFVEAIGYPAMHGSDPLLVRAVYRRAHSGGAPSDGAVRHVRLVEQLRNLSPEDASRGLPVQLTGVVTWAHPAADFFYVRDVSGGAYVAQPPSHPAAVIVGLKVDVAGTSALGAFAPIVLATNVKYTASVDLPDAPAVTLEQALTGVEDAQWVTMSGYVRAVTRGPPWLRLELTTSAGEFAALLPPDTPADKLRGAVVRVRGVCSAITNRKRQLTGIQVWVPSLEYIEIEEAEPADPFAVAARSVASLRQFGGVQSSNRRVRVSGVVLGQSPGRVHIQDGAEGLLVLSRTALRLAPGDRVEAVGFPGWENGRLVLREAVDRRTGFGAEPVPVAVRSLVPVNPELDGRLVALDANLLDVVGVENGTRLIAQAGTTIFGALLGEAKETLPRDWDHGSELRLTGLYRIQFDEYKRPQNVVLQLRSPADVRILRRASWWTVRHAAFVSASLAAGIVAGFGWVLALRRRVRNQTAQIREQYEREKAARLEAALSRASKLESLGILAGGIAHDFNNLLTVILCNLSLVRLGAPVDAERERCLRESERAASRARDLTQQLLTFAKGGAPVRSSIMLPDIVRESADFALHGSKSRCEFDIGRDVWPANVDKGQIAQVVQNIVLNASQATPKGGVIRIALLNVELAAGQVPPLTAGRYLKLTIADTGCGIPAEQLPRIFDPYFTTKRNGSGLGLATVYSIVKQHDGHVEVESAVDKGTTFTIWLPASNEPPVTFAAVSDTLPRSRGRVLFMDDEASIRQMGGMVLRRMGVDVTEVGDGAAVVREYLSARAAGQPYDAVVLDLTVPGGMGGAEALQQLRQVNPDVRAIVSSGYSSDPVMANFRAHGFSAVVCKPYEASTLAHAVAELLPNADPVDGRG